MEGKLTFKIFSYAQMNENIRNNNNNNNISIEEYMTMNAVNGQKVLRD